VIGTAIKISLSNASLKYTGEITSCVRDIGLSACCHFFVVEDVKNWA